MKRSSQLLAILVALASLAAAPSALDTAFKKFWDAANPQEAAKAADALVNSGVNFDEAYARLKRGRTYAADAPHGVVRLHHHFALGDFWYSVDVPQNYDPARSYQVRVQLHGGVMGRQDGTIRGNGSIGALAGAEQIYVLPASWKDAPWWSTSQVQNMRAILDTVKRLYNVDENRIVLAGVSDGATAAYYFAMLDTTPFASFLTLNGALAVLQSPSIGLDGSLFPQNLVNKPFFIVNGGRDPLYPTSLVEPYIEHIKKKGVEVLYHAQPNGVHNTSWWPQEKDAVETFVHDHPRHPLPDHLSWQTDLKNDSNRAHWLVIDKLMDKSDMREPLPDVNIFARGPQEEFGARVDGSDGLRIWALVRNSDADSFGFRPGDIVTKINGQPPPPGKNFLEWLNTSEPRTDMTITVTRDGEPLDLHGFFDPVEPLPPLPLFPYRSMPGRVDLDREGNTVRATTRGVTEFTLLLSPDMFDFNQPLKVVADGRTVFEGKAKKTVATLMRWAAHDNDRTMLFGAEVHVKLVPQH